MSDTPIFDKINSEVGEPPVTRGADGEPTLKPQPKVIAGAVTGLILTVIVGAINAVTPDLFAGLGQWGVVVFAGVVALGSALAAYIKRPANG